VLRFRFLRALIISILVSLTSQAVLAQSQPPPTTPPNDQTGVSPYQSFGGQRENISLATGNLNLEIPLLTLPGRAGRDLTIALQYDSAVYTLSSHAQSASFHPSPPEYSWGSESRLPNLDSFWRVNVPVLSIAAQWEGSTSAAQIYCWTNFVLTLSDGSKHQFFNRAGCFTFDSTDGNNPYPSTNLSPGLSQDNSYITLDTSNATDVVAHLKDGTALHFPVAYSFLLTGEYATLPSKIEDTNGNIISISETFNGFTSPVLNSITDTAGRSVTFSSSGLTYKNSSGTTETTTFTFTSCSTTTDFTEPATPEINNVESGTGPCLSSVTLPSGLSYHFQYNATDGELSKITYPTGGYTRYDFQTLLHFWEAPISVAGNCPDCTFPSGTAASFRELTARHVCRDPLGNCSTPQEDTTTYTATIDGTKDTNEFMDVVDPLGNRTRYQFSFRTNADAPVFFPSLLFPRELVRSLYQGQSTLLRTVQTNYSATDSSGRPTASSLPIRATTTLADSGQVKKVECDYSSTPFGLTVLDNVIEKREFNYGAGAFGNLLKRTDYTWVAVNPVNSLDYTVPTLNMLSLKASEIVYDSTSNQCQGQSRACSQTTYEYDKYTSGIAASGAVQHDASFTASYTARGNVTAVNRWRNTDGALLTTRNQFDDAGNILSTTDPASNITSFSFADAWGNASCEPSSGSAKAYLTKTTNALGQITTSTFNSCTGTRASSRDANSETTTFSYDGMGRLTQTVAPSDPSGQHPETTVAYDESSHPLSVVNTSEITSSSNLVKTIVVDGLGRVTQSQLNSDPQGTDFVDTTYDSLGRKATESNPHRSSGDVTDGITSYAYDALGRLIKVIHPDGTSINTSYTGAATEVTDEGNGTKVVQRISQTDGLGRLLSICEVSSTGQLGPGGTPGSCGQVISGTGFLTTYTYDGLDDLTAASQGGLVPRNFTYDSLSHITQATNPESGTISYSYDNDGNVLKRIDARNITTNYSYDKLNRLLSKSYLDGTTPDPVTPTVSFVYDSCPTSGCPSGISPQLAVGRLVEASTPSAATFSSYDALGRIVGQWQCTPSNCGSSYFPLAFTHNLTGNLTSESNGFGVIVSYSYDAATRLQGATSSLSDAKHPATLLSNAQYSPLGSVISETLGNGVTESLAYNSRVELQSVATGGITITNIPATPGKGSVTIVGSENSDDPPATHATGSVTISGSLQKTCSETPPIGKPCAGYTYDSGTVSITVGTFTSQAKFNQLLNSTASAIITSLAGQLNGTGSPVTATIVGSAIDITSRATGSPANLTLTASATSTLSSFFATASGATLTGGAGGQTVFNAGTVSITVNGTPTSASYSGGSTTSSVATALATGLTSGSLVNASASGGVVTITSKNGGLTTNYSLSAASTTSDPQGLFTSPAFTASVSGASLTGGTDSSTSTQGSTIYTLSVGYAPNGNVTGGNDSINGNWTYAYDDFNRLTTSNKNSGQQAFSYVYDRFGNRWQQNVTAGSGGTSSLSFSGNNNRIDGSPYDAAGNLLKDASNTYSYDAESRLIQVVGTSGTSSYVYDANGRRVRKTVAGATTDYLYDLDGNAITEVNSSGGWTRGEVYAGKRHLLTYSGGTSGSTYFAHADWVGTERLRSDMTGAACESITSLPFGDGETTSGGCGDPSTRHFTGKERDPESGLDNFGARYNSSSIGRFMSVDPSRVSVKLFDPQTWNRYVYARDNPLRYVDANGQWSTPVHNEIIDDVFKDTLSDVDRTILKQASVFVDQDQSVADSFMHGMRALDQSVQEAMDLGQAFVESHLDTAVQYQIQWENAGNSGWNPGALFQFGMALHTVTDADSPWHDHYQEAWGHYWDPLGSAGHAAGEYFLGTKRFSAVELAQARYDAWLLWVEFLNKLAEERKKQEEQKKQKTITPAHQ
jgi:RHS repeat-associated protein